MDCRGNRHALCRASGARCDCRCHGRGGQTPPPPQPPASHKPKPVDPPARPSKPASSNGAGAFRWAVIVDTEPPSVVVLHLQADADAVVRLLTELGHTAWSAQLTG